MMTSDERPLSNWIKFGLFVGTFLAPYLLWMGGVVVMSLRPGSAHADSLRMSSMMLLMYLLYFPSGLLGFLLYVGSVPVQLLIAVGYTIYLAMTIWGILLKGRHSFYKLLAAFVLLIVLNCFGCAKVWNEEASHVQASF